MNDIRDTDDLKAMEKLCQKVRASIPAVLEGDAPIEENVWGDDVANAPAVDASESEKKHARNAGSQRRRKWSQAVRLLGLMLRQCSELWIGDEQAPLVEVLLVVSGTASGGTSG
jgi:hypothetical protein